MASLKHETWDFYITKHFPSFRMTWNKTDNKWKLKLYTNICTVRQASHTENSSNTKPSTPSPTNPGLQMVLPSPGEHIPHSLKFHNPEPQSLRSQFVHCQDSLLGWNKLGVRLLTHESSNVIPGTLRQALALMAAGVASPEFSNMGSMTSES